MSLEYTSVAAIEPLHAELKATFRSGITRPLAWRKHQLKQLGFLIQDNEKAFILALSQDLGRPAMETQVGELEPMKAEINEAYAELDKWARPKRVKTSLTWVAAKPTVYSEPKGVVLIIGTWNFPIALLLGPTVGAISAGCPAILKPAEQTPAVAALFAALVPSYLDPSAYKVVNGAIEQTTALLTHRFDHIFYTGSGQVGKVIARAAAEHLTPITLELGGKSPACVFDDADIKTAGRRIMWGKYTNAGQVCISPDYVLCSKEIQPQLIAAFQSALEEFSATTKDSPAKSSLAEDSSYTKIVSPTHFARLEKLLETTKGRVAIGGGKNAETNKIEVTVIADVGEDDALMQGEIFGPILPIVTVESKEAMLDHVNDRDTPLALYAFTKKTANRDFIFNNTRSGTFVQNDVLIQFTVKGLPFGGTGPSGYGNYHGKNSFDTFSHQRSSASIPSWMESLLASRYPPYTPAKLKLLLLVTGQTIKREATLYGRLGRILSLLAFLTGIAAVGKMFSSNRTA